MMVGRRSISGGIDKKAWFGYVSLSEHGTRIQFAKPYKFHYNKYNFWVRDRNDIIYLFWTGFSDPSELVA